MLSIDWERVGRGALPAIALVLAGVVGYGLGQRVPPPAADPNRLVTATRGWRAAPVTPSRPAQRDLATEMQPPTPRVGLKPAGDDRAIGPPTRFRDFTVGASSWELAHPPVLAADGDPYTFWHAWKTERFGSGDWLTLRFPEERVITRIGLLPGRVGHAAGTEGQVRSVLVKGAGAAPQKLLFKDRPVMQYRDLARPVRTRKLILRIVTVLPGSESGHIVVPEVQAWGYDGSDRISKRPTE